MTETTQIFVIGAGAMAEAFIRGITERGVLQAGAIAVVGRQRQERPRWLHDTYGVTVPPAWDCMRTARLVVVAVKPADVAQALIMARPFLCHQPILSFAAGITIDFMKQAVEAKSPLIRAMPNIPVAVLEGATAVTFAADVRDEDQEFVRHLLRQLGEVVDVPESMMNAATAFSGSGPGFVCYFLEAMENAAVSLGFSAEDARLLLLQTVVGTAQTLREWGLSPAELRHRVTSPNGTTHAGIETMQQGGLEQVVLHALQAAAQRSEQMGQTYAVLPATTEAP